MKCVQNSKTTVGGRGIELVLQKPSSDTQYWPYLTKEKKKYHWLKVDFKKWKDEDDSDDEVAESGAPGGLGGDANIDDVSKLYFSLKMCNIYIFYIQIFILDAQYDGRRCWWS